MTRAGLLDLVAQTRRAMPRNNTVMAICDEAERLSNDALSNARKASVTKKPKRDRKAYIREYMKKYRAKKK